MNDLSGPYVNKKASLVGNLICCPYPKKYNSAQPRQYGTTSIVYNSMNRYLSYAICHCGFEKRIAIVGGIVRSS